jgi:poly(3-hydroxybutyrate) depolymerase
MKSGSTIGIYQQIHFQAQPKRELNIFRVPSGSSLSDTLVLLFCVLHGCENLLLSPYLHVVKLF